MAEPWKIPDGFEHIPLDVSRQPLLSSGAQAVQRVHGGPPPPRPYSATGEALPFMDEFKAAVQASTSYLGSELGLNPGEGDVSFGDLYSGYKELEDEAQAKYRQEHPGRSITAAIVGGAAIPIKPVGKVLTTLGNVLRGAGAGASWGALFGFGEGSGLKNRSESAAIGAGIGLGAGAAIPLLFRGGGLVVNMLRGKGVSSDKAQTRAAQLLQEALTADGISPSDIIAMTAGGKSMIVADLGPKTKALLGSAYRMSGQGKGTLEDFLNNRSTAQFGRLTKDIAEGLGVDPKDFARVGGEIVEKRAADAEGNYAAAYARELDVTADYRIKSILDKPFGESALKNAAKMAKDAGESIRDTNGHYTVKAIDFMKRWMDDRIDMAFRSGRSQQGIIWKGIRAEMLSAVDRQSPEFAAARAAYGGDSALLDALKNGRKFMRGDSEDLVTAFSKLSAGEQEMFRLGAAREMREVMGRVVEGGDAARMFKLPNNRERLRAIFSDEKTFTKFMDNVGDEITMQETRNSILGGSPTATRVLEDAGFAKGPVGDAVNAAADIARYGTGRGLISAGVKQAGLARTRLLKGLNQRTSDALVEQTVNPAQGLRQFILAPPPPLSQGPLIRGAVQPLVGDPAAPEALPGPPKWTLPEGFAPQSEAARPRDDLALAVQNAAKGPRGLSKAARESLSRTVASFGAR